MRKLTIPILFAVLFLSCKKPVELYTTDVSILLLNQQGQNLLSPTSNLQESNIEAFVVNNGKILPFNKPTPGNPKGFLVTKTNDNQENLVLLTFDSFGKGVEFTTSLIKLGSYGTDTVKCQIASSGSHTRVTKVWYNGTLKFDETITKTAPIITVIK